MSDIVFEDCDIDVEGSPIAFWIEPGITLGSYGNVVFRNIRLKGKRPIMLQGRGDSVLKNITFENVSGTIAADRPVDMRSVENIRFAGFTVTSGGGETSPPDVNSGVSWEYDP